MKLLAVDDVEDNLVSLAASLRAFLPGCDVETARSGPEGIERARALQPDTILLDVEMPGMNGFEACRALKADPATRHVPVVFMTSRSEDPASRVRGLEAGGDAFLFRPVDPGELTAQVQAMVRIKEAEDLLRARSETLEQMVSERTGSLSRRLRHLDVMERITRITVANAEIRDVLSGVLDELLDVFGADRAWFAFPCDPDAPTFAVPFERTRPGWPGALARAAVLPMTPDARDLFRLNLGSPEPVQSGPLAPHDVPSSVAGPYSIRSQVQVGVRPRTGSPWALGIHHCAEARFLDADDLALFKAIADRVSESLSTLIMLKDLRESETKFRALAEFAPVGIYETDAGGDCVFSNRAWREMSGLSGPEAAGRGWVNGLHPDDRAAIQERWYRSVREDGSWQGDYRFVSTSGKVTWVEGAAFPLTDEQGTVTGYIGTNVDVTERKRVEAVQRFLLQCGYGASGEDFFQSIARFLAESLGMDFVCVDRLEGDGLTARTVAVWCDGSFQDNVTYALADTPCGEVVGKAVCCFPASVCQYFPRDEVLRDLRAESYVGVTLFGHTGRPIGLIAVIGRNPLADRKVAEATLQQVALRAAGELERKEAEDAVREKVDELSRWQQVTLGREMRILELKREVNEVLVQAERERRYTSVLAGDVPEVPAR